MPRDVHTRWNSTYDMLYFAYEYKNAVMGIMVICDLKLQQFEIDNDDWEIIKQLQDVLKVSQPVRLTKLNSVLTSSTRFLKTLHSSSLKMEPHPLPPSFL